MLLSPAAGECCKSRRRGMLLSPAGGECIGGVALPGKECLILKGVVRGWGCETLFLYLKLILKPQAKLTNEVSI